MQYNTIVGGARSPGDRKGKKTMEKKHIVNRMLVSAYSAKEFLDRGNTVLAAYYYGVYIADNGFITVEDVWTIADDPTVPYITREHVTEMFENAHTVYEKLIAPAFTD